MNSNLGSAPLAREQVRMLSSALDDAIPMRHPLQASCSSTPDTIRCLPFLTSDNGMSASRQSPERLPLEPGRAALALCYERPPRSAIGVKPSLEGTSLIRIRKTPDRGSDKLPRSSTEPGYRASAAPAIHLLGPSRGSGHGCTVSSASPVVDDWTSRLKHPLYLKSFVDRSAPLLIRRSSNRT